MKKIKYTLYSLFLTFGAFAQDNTGTDLSHQGLRADGKIYVVAAVLVTILLGILVYLIRLDRKISKLEKH